MTNPLDNLNTQLPGRLLAVESLLVLMLGQKPNAAKLLQLADTMVAQAEAQTFQEGVGNEAYALEMFTAARAKPAAVTGERPSLEWVAPTALLVDGTYQRDLSERSLRLIRRMVSEFSWSRMKPPIVVRTGPASLHIIDGQHTAIAAATIGLAEIPVFVVAADSLDERARAFVGHNTDRVTVSSIDIYRALLASGDPDAQDVANVCRRAGVRIRVISPSSAIAEGDTAAVGVVRSLVRRRGVMRARKVLQCLVKARRAPIGASEIIAVDKIVCEERPEIDLDELTAAIVIEGNAGVARAVADARLNRVPLWRCLKDRWLARIAGGGA